MSNNLIYYFLIANYNTKKEIGEYYEESEENNINLSKIKSSAKEIVLSNDKKKEKTNKVAFQEYNFYYKITNLDILYLAVVKKNIKYKENLIFELIEDIDHQGIKKLVDKNGELTLVGKQNLKFCIEQDQEANRKSSNSTSSSSITDLFSGQKKDTSKLSLINNELNDIQTNVKESIRNAITNVAEMQDLDDKSEKIKDVSFQFQRDSSMLERKIRYRKILHRAMIICIAVIILIIILYFIFK